MDPMIISIVNFIRTLPTATVVIWNKDKRVPEDNTKTYDHNFNTYDGLTITEQRYSCSYSTIRFVCIV